MHRKSNDNQNLRPASRPRPLTAAEARLLVQARCAPRTRALVHTALVTGSRRDELAALRWADIDTEKRCARIHGRKATNRTVALTVELVEHLGELGRAEGAATDHVFVTRNGEPMSPRAIAQTLRLHALRACGRPIALHELRRWALRRQKS
jgi:integrase